MPRPMNAPSLPQTPGVSGELADYLRRFALWTQNSFNQTVQTNSAVPRLLMQSTTTKTVWSITIDDSGVLHTTQLTPGHPP
jgi:hypothetical protein